MRCNLRPRFDREEGNMNAMSSKGLDVDDLEGVSGGWANPIAAFGDAIAAGVPADAGQSMTGPSTVPQGLLDLATSGMFGNSDPDSGLDTSGSGPDGSNDSGAEDSDGSGS